VGQHEPRDHRASRHGRGDDFKAATPESFEILGKLLATMANEKLEALFMSID
jgi:hypothetical protein